MYMNYIKYLHETLGVNYLPHAAGDFTEEALLSSPSTGGQQYSVVFFSQNRFSDEQMSLFKKMRSALGLTELLAPLTTLNRINEFECETYVSFDAIPELGLTKVGDITQVNNRKYVYLHSPQILIENSQLKKDAWDLMKSQIGQYLPKLPLN